MLQWYECKCIIRTSGVTILCHVCRLFWKKFFITFWKMVPMICGALRDLVQSAQFKKREFSWKNYFEPFSLWNILTHGRSSKFFFKILKILLLASLTNQYLYSQRHFQNPLKHLIIYVDLLFHDCFMTFVLYILDVSVARIGIQCK